MLNQAVIQLCGVLLRRAGYRLDSIDVQLGIEHVQAGKEFTKPWHPLLADALNNLYNAKD